MLLNRERTLVDFDAENGNAGHKARPETPDRKGEQLRNQLQKDNEHVDQPQCPSAVG